MTELSTLFAVKILIKNLKYSSTRLDSLLKEVEALIEYEKSRCTDEYSNRLQNLNDLINSEI